MLRFWRISFARGVAMKKSYEEIGSDAQMRIGGRIAGAIMTNRMGSDKVSLSI